MDALLMWVLNESFENGYSFLMLPILAAILVGLADMVLSFVVPKMSDLWVEVLGPVAFICVMWFGTIPFVRIVGFGADAMMSIGASFLLAMACFEVLFKRARQEQLRSQEF